MNIMSKTPVSSRSTDGMTAENILTEIQANLLECKVCFERFSVQKRDHTARNLPCGHVLCLKCVCTLSHPVYQNLECPFCRKQCEASGTSECRPLADLQELLQSGGCPRLPAHHQEISWTGGLGSRALNLHSAFGGWGKITNPCGIAVAEPAGQILVAHGGKKRVTVFSQQGTFIRSFGDYGHSPADVCYPLDIAVALSGHIMVTDAGEGAIKIFDSRGCPVLSIQDSFKLPWGIDVDDRGRILVTDVQRGTVTQLVLDFARGAVLANRVVLRELRYPQSVASCRVSGNVAIVEHLGKYERFQGSFTPSCLKIFTNDFLPLMQMDSFGLSLMDSVSMSISSVVFDTNGDVIVGDSQRGMVWSLGKPQKTPVLNPLVCGLLRPAGLAITALNVLIVLDSGDHSVKLFSEYTEDLYRDKT